MLYAISYVKGGHSFHGSSIYAIYTMCVPCTIVITTLSRTVKSEIDYQYNNITNNRAECY